MLKDIIAKAENDLINYKQFYHLCQELYALNNQQKIYFIPADQYRLESGIKTRRLCYFLDYLAKKLRQNSSSSYPKTIYLQSVNLYLPGKIIKTYKIRQPKTAIKEILGAKIALEMAGEGMIGRVAKLTINDQESFAFKSFFDPNYVWQHGPWAEIPVGLYLKANKVIKDFAEFKFAGKDWTVWEWIDPEETPELRPGIFYDEFAKKHHLTRLNPLNYLNYNPNLIRLDPGGVQKEYPGRKFWDFIYSVIFYLLKLKKEGIFSLLIYLKWANISYSIKRIILLIYPKFYQKNGTIRKS